MNSNLLAGYVCRACHRPAEVLVQELGSMCKRCWKWLGWNKVKNPPQSRFGPGMRREYNELLMFLEENGDNTENIEARLELRIEGDIKGEQNV